MDDRKLPSAALFVTVFGALSFMPPLVLLFNIEARLFGVPIEVIYLFTAWLVLILVTAWFARRMPQAPADQKPDDDR